MGKTRGLTTTTYYEGWSRQRLGAVAGRDDAADHYTYTRLDVTFGSQKQFTDWVHRFGNTSTVYVLRWFTVEVDENYDFNDPGMVRIAISEPSHYCSIYKAHGTEWTGPGWGHNVFGEHNLLPPFDPRAYIPAGYPRRLVKLGSEIVEEFN